MLSLCTIVKNEESEIRSFLEHIHDFVDEIILVDTGSTDKTKKIASEFPKVKIFDFVWENNFAKARNESLKHASGEWILVLDADERISSFDFDEVKKIIEENNKKKIDGFTLIQRNYSQDVNTRNFISSYEDKYPETKKFRGWTENHVVRLFRKKPEIFYSFKVHELVEPSIQAMGGKIRKTNIPIHHFTTTEKEKVEKKLKLYNDIIAKKCEETPFDDRAWFEYGINLLKMKRVGEATAVFEKTRALNPQHPLVCAYLIEAYGKLKNASAIIESYKRGISINPGDINLYLNMGEIFVANKKYDSALKAYAQALLIDKKSIVALFAFGACSYELKDFVKARQALQHVLKVLPTHPKAKELLEKISTKV
ncbi:glycosyltransferase [Candidatus Woesearchaeota archaeon]|nr:glycosyltransferase [Candidatus Woesearchaeota archaeon]